MSTNSTLSPLPSDVGTMRVSYPSQPSNINSILTCVYVVLELWWAIMVYWIIPRSWLRFKKSLLGTFCTGAYLVRSVSKFVSRRFSIHRPLTKSLSRSLFFGIFEWLSQKENIGLCSLCYWVGSNNLIHDSGVQTVWYWFWKYWGFEWY